MSAETTGGATDRRASRLAARLARRIAREGPISLADFMAAALTDPQDGYYSRQDPFGAAGDFVTAPEISQMFGELIGLWCAETWRRIGAPESVQLVELGPGRGTLLSDALRAARLLPDFLEALELHLVETSPALRRLQRERLGAFDPVWHDNMGELPEGPMLLVANEFFDALPIRQFERTTAGWAERRIGLANGDPAQPQFGFVLVPPSPLTARLLPPHLAAAPLGAVVEVSPAALSLAGEIGRRLHRHGGAALVIDYGPAESRPGITLQALRRHRSANVLAAPGSADLTAHVDFQSLAEAATAAGARIFGPVGQGAFLDALGIGARAERLSAGASPRQAADVTSALERLTAPAQMGTHFKVLGLAGSEVSELAGF